MCRLSAWGFPDWRDSFDVLEGIRIDFDGGAYVSRMGAVKRIDEYGFNNTFRDATGMIRKAYLSGLFICVSR